MPDHQEPIGIPTFPAEPPRRAGAGPIAIVFTLFALALAIGWQNMPADTQIRALGLTPHAQPEPLPFDIVEPAPMQAKIYIRSAHEMNNLAPGQGDDFFAVAQQAVDEAATGPGTRLVSAIIAGELEGPDAALERLDDIEDELTAADMDAQIAPAPGSKRAIALADFQQRQRDALRLDLPLLRTLYESGSDALDADARERIETRYRYVGRLALAWDLEDADPDRAAVLAGNTIWRLFGLLGFILIALAAFFAGLVILVLAIVGLISGKLRPRAPTPAVHGGALLETVGIFAFLFFLMGAGLTYAAHNRPELGIFQLPLQWALILVPVWPLLRGWRARDWRAALGITTGRGFFREVSAGIVGYLGAVPLFVAGAALSFLVLTLDVLLFGEHPAPPSNPVLDILIQADWMTVLLLMSLTTVWAPLCEEMIFRGAMFSHLRRRFGWVLAAIATTLAFAFLHSYGPLLLWPIMALGFSFATIRWWRGSLIACITAHAIHNTALMLMMLVLVGIFPG